MSELCFRLYFYMEGVMLSKSLHDSGFSTTSAPSCPAMTLRDHIAHARDALRAGQFVNEASVCTGIVLPLLQALDWPVFSPQIVAPEFTLEGRRVDYALCHPRNRPIVFIEVKQPGQSAGADRQLFEYAFHTGVPMAVLTDGQEWHFYLPAEQGDYQPGLFIPNRIS